MPEQQDTAEAAHAAEAVDGVWVRGLKGPNGEFGALGRITVRGHAQDVYQFVSRVEEQPKWHSGVRSSRVVSVDGPVSQVHQSLKWNFLAIRGEFTMHLTMREDPEQLRIHTHMQQGSLMKRFHSTVGISPLPSTTTTTTTSTSSSSRASALCQVEMSLFMQPRVCVPLGIRHMVGSQVQRQLRGVLQGLKDHLEGEEYAAAAAAGSRGRVGSCSAVADGGGRKGLGFGAWPLQLAPLKLPALGGPAAGLGQLALAGGAAARPWGGSNPWQQGLPRLPQLPQLQQLAAGLQVHWQ